MKEPQQNVEYTNAQIAVNRFGYGARVGELQAANENPKQWIKNQLKPILFSQDLGDSNDILNQAAKYREQKVLEKKGMLPNKPEQMVTKNFARSALRAMAADTLKQSIHSSHSVSWRLLDFFSNHFSVSAQGRLMAGLAPTLEREAIAPNLLGHFEDMLLAVSQHPAMIIYLNNEKSFGENSRIGQKRNKGLNENLAREILELHTLGVDGPYNQQDVIELAKGMTGWSIKKSITESNNGFVFRKYGHEPGKRILLGKPYLQNGVEQGKQMLKDLATHPKTAEFLCQKIAHHFVSETPSTQLLASMQATWMQTRGNIQKVMNAMFEHDDAWLSTAQKFKTPREYVISTFRALSLPLSSKRPKDKTLLYTLINLGQQPFNAGSPAGYSDANDDWLSATGLMARIDWVNSLSKYVKHINIESLIHTIFAGAINQNIYQTIMHAESRQMALIMLLMSPEFLRR